MNDKNKRNELLTTLADINELIEELEYKRETEKQEAIDITNQLLQAYTLKLEIIKII